MVAPISKLRRNLRHCTKSRTLLSYHLHPVYAYMQHVHAARRALAYGRRGGRIMGVRDVPAWRVRYNPLKRVFVVNNL